MTRRRTTIVAYDPFERICSTCKRRYRDANNGDTWWEQNGACSYDCYVEANARIREWNAQRTAEKRAAAVARGKSMCTATNKAGYLCAAHAVADTDRCAWHRRPGDEPRPGRPRLTAAEIIAAVSRVG